MNIENIIQYDPENDFEILKKQEERKRPFQAILEDVDIADKLLSPQKFNLQQQAKQKEKLANRHKPTIFDLVQNIDLDEDEQQPQIVVTPNII